MKILWHSVHPKVGSGYGQQTDVVTRALKRAGHDVVISCSYGQMGFSDYYDGMLVLPCGASANLYGNDRVTMHFNNTQSDLVWSLLDVFVLNPAVWKGLPWAAWLPLDADPLMARNVPALQACRWPVAMSRFGERVLRDAGFDPLYVPHMIDDAVFYPEDRQRVRRSLSRMWGRSDLDGQFIVCVNSANVGIPPRKNFDVIFEAWSLFAQAHDDALLYMHTDMTGAAQGGDDLSALMTLYDIDQSRVIVPHQWQYLTGMIRPEYLRYVYSASDVLLNPSLGEGFGLPAVEAQMCGCPVIQTDYSAMSELCFEGHLVPGKLAHTAPGTRQCRVSASDVYDALELSVMWSGDPAVRQRAHDGAYEYRTESVMERWMLPALDHIANE
jgi:glycosyltransferase involved in cell wall biosynthesis